MRWLKFGAAFAAALAVLSPADAGEIFLCNDGRTIELTTANRAKYKDDPCVAEWFKANKDAVAAEQSKTKEPPQKMKGIPASCKKPWDCLHLSYD